MDFSGDAKNDEETSYNILPPLKDDPYLLIKIVIGTIVTVILSIAIFAINKNVIEVFVFLLLAIVYYIACLKKVSAERKGIGITLWTPKIPDSDKIYSGGIYWRWFPFQWLYLWPTEQTVIDIPKQKVVTAEKVIPATATRELKVYTEANIEINAVVYFFWPNTASGLLCAYKNAPHPDNLEKLFTFFKPYLASKVRKIAGRFSWLDVRMSTDDYEKELHDGIVNDTEGAIRKAGITKFKVENEIVTLPETLEDSITKEQEEIYKKAAGIHTAELNKIAIKAKGEGDAYAREQLLKAMKRYPTQAVNIMYEEMAKGESSTIFFELPSEMKEMLKEGGDVPDELKAIWDITNMVLVKDQKIRSKKLMTFPLKLFVKSSFQKLNGKSMKVRILPI